MTTYRLPDGTEGTHVRESTDYEEKLWVLHSQLGLILIDRDKLTEVEPPLPPEPPNDGAFWFDPKEDLGEVWYRAGDGWFRMGGKYRFGWSEVCEHTDPAKWVRLVKDPADEARELPLMIPTSHAGYKLILRESSYGYLGVAIGDAADVGITVHGARQAAAALWAWAAREVEKP